MPAKLWGSCSIQAGSYPFSEMWPKPARALPEVGRGGDKAALPTTI